MTKKRKSFSINESLKKGLSQTVMSAQSYASQMRYDAVPLTKIETDPDNPRKLHLTFSDLPDGPKKDDELYNLKINEIKSLESLSNSIKNEGLLNAVVVYKNNSSYRLVAGERRCLASLLAGKEDIPAKILDKKPGALKKSMLQWIENIEREDLSLWERLQNLEKIKEGYEVENNESVNATALSKLLGCSLPHASNYMFVLNANELIQNAIKGEKVNNLEKAALIAKVSSSGVQQQALEACLQGATLKNIKSLITSLEKQKEAKETKLERPQSNSAGRKATRVNLGHVKKVSVVKKILDLFFKHEEYSHFKKDFKDFNLDNYSDASKAFAHMLKLLESES